MTENAYIEVQEDDVESLNLLFTMDEQEFSSFIQTLNETPSKIGFFALQEAIFDNDFDFDFDLYSTIELAGSMAISLRRRSGDADAFAEMIVRGCSKSLPELDQVKAKERLAMLIDFDSPIGRSVNALALCAERFKNLCKVSIDTEIKPIFKETTPVGLIPIHSLKMVVHLKNRHDDQGVEEYCVSLDKRDLLRIKSLCEKALERENELRELTENLSAAWVDCDV